MAITTFKRYEMKFMLTQTQLNTVIPILLKYMEYDKHCPGGKEYSIYNIYYDTPDSQIIRHSISKPYYKEKLRLRSYHIPRSLDEVVFLELKKKIGGIVNKRRIILPLQIAYEFVEFGKYPDPTENSSPQITREIEYYLSYNDVQPAVYIGYKRLAFFGKEDKDFRVTFDYDILTRRQDLKLESGSYGDPLLEAGHYLMEVKISGAVPLWLSQTLSEMKIYKTHFSKYGKEYENECTFKERSVYLNYPYAN